MSLESVPTNIANLALSHCGVSKPIANLYTEHSVEAQMILTWYDTARRMTLRSLPWSFATQQMTPALVANFPTNEWMFAYQYPANALKMVRFMSWRLNNDTRRSRIPYRIMQPVSYLLSAATPPQSVPYAVTTGLWLYTNWPGVNTSLPTVIEYIFDNTNVTQWPDGFNTAFSLKLAELIITTLTTGNPQQQKTQIQADYKTAIDIASGEDCNEEQRPEEPQSEFIRGRNGDMGYGYPGMTWVAEPAGFVVQ
jgi:hypothetical protein